MATDYTPPHVCGGGTVAGCPVCEDTDKTAEPISAAGASLALILMGKMAEDTAATTNALIESLTNQLAEANARIDLIRTGVAALLDGPWMPTPDTIITALYPMHDRVKQYIEDHKTEG